jgi:hypothetical protein
MKRPENVCFKIRVMVLFKRILPPAICLGLISCRAINPVGHYELRYFPKVTMDVRENGEFQFVKIIRNPYLHPFDHPDQTYFVARGTWLKKKNKLVLTQSQKSLADKPSEKIDDRENSTLEYSTYTFIDIYRDTIDVLYGKFADSTWLGVLHGKMKNLSWTSKSDTAEIHFFGYKPLTLIRDDKQKREVVIRLYPEFRLGSIPSGEFVVRKKRLLTRRFKFERKDGRATPDTGYE